MNSKPLLIAAAIGLIASATVTLAEFDVLRQPIQGVPEQQFQGDPNMQKGGNFQGGDPNFRRNGQNFQKDDRDFQRDGTNFQGDGKNFRQDQFQDKFKGDPNKRQFINGERRPEGMQESFRGGNPGENTQRPGQGDQGYGDPNKQPEDTRWFGNENCKTQEECDQIQKQADERRENEQQRMDERRFQDMKRGMKQFEKGVKMTQNMIKKIKPRLDKCGIGMPIELTQALDLAPKAVEKLNASKTADELEDIISDITDIGSAMQKWGPKMGDLSRLCEMLKRSDKEFKIITRDVEKLSKRITSNKKMDLSGLLTELKAQSAKMTESWSEAKKIAKTDPEAAFAKLDDDFYGEMDNFHNIRRSIETVLDVSRGLREAKGEVSKYTREIAKLKKRKVDTTEIEGLLSQFKAKVGEITKFVKTKGFDTDDLVDLIEETFAIREELQDALQEYGVSQGEPQFKGEKGFNFQLPQGFERQGPPQEVENGGGAGFDGGL